VRSNHGSDRQERSSKLPLLSVGCHQLAVETHNVDDDDECSASKRGRCSRSRADDVITVDSVDHLLPPRSPSPPPPKSIAAINAQRRAEFFGLVPASPKHDPSDEMTPRPNHAAADVPATMRVSPLPKVKHPLSDFRSKLGREVR